MVENSALNLHELQEAIAGKMALEAELESLNQTANELHARLRCEKLHLEYEQSDVETLEGNTLKAVFYTVIGQKETRLAKEEDEAEEAKQQYERTLGELEQVNARIKRIELDLQKLKRLEQDYTRGVEKLLATVGEIEPCMSQSDALALKGIRNELTSQKQKQEYYTELMEESKKLLFCIQLVQDSLQDMIDEDRAGTVFGEYAARREAEERRGDVARQAQRLKNCFDRGVNFVNDYSLDIKSIDSMITRVAVACNDHSDGPNVYDRLSGVPDLALNLHGMLHELERKIERSKRFQSELEGRLSNLIEKYQEN